MVGLQLYDRISSKVVSPTRAPSSDAVLKWREVLDTLKDLEAASAPHGLLAELKATIDEINRIFLKPHFKVLLFNCFNFFQIRKYFSYLLAIS